MKKKMLSAFLCAAMAVTLVAGCGAPAADAGKDKGGDSKKEASEGIPKDEIKVGFVHISDPSDMGYTYNHDLGTKEMQKELGLTRSSTNIMCRKMQNVIQLLENS